MNEFSRYETASAVIGIVGFNADEDHQIRCKAENSFSISSASRSALLRVANFTEGEFNEPHYPTG